MITAIAGEVSVPAVDDGKLLLAWLLRFPPAALASYGKQLPGALICIPCRSGPGKEDTVSRLTLIVASLVVGVVLAVGAAFATSGVLSTPPAPANKALYNYGP